MKNKIYIFLIWSCLPLALAAQQLPDRSPFGETSFVWNPAMTAIWDYWELGATFRQQWVGFNDAPQSTTVSIQYPFNKYNNSLGGYFMHDAVRPIQSNVFALTYAYKLEPQWKRGDQLSLGLLVNVTHVFVDGLDVVVNDPDDDLLPSGENNKVSPNAGVGIFYTTNARRPFEKNSVYAGLAINQLVPINLAFTLSNSDANLKRVIHANALFGTRIIKDQIMIEPGIWVNYSAANILNANLSLLIEKQDAFWAGLSFNTNQTLSVQLGTIFNKGLAKDGAIRAGVLGSYNIGTFGPARGLGYECYVAYRFFE